MSSLTIIKSVSRSAKRLNNASATSMLTCLYIINDKALLGEEEQLFSYLI